MARHADWAAAGGGRCLDNAAPEFVNGQRPMVDTEADAQPVQTAADPHLNRCASRLL